MRGFISHDGNHAPKGPVALNDQSPLRSSIAEAWPFFAFRQRGMLDTGLDFVETSVPTGWGVDGDISARAIDTTNGYYQIIDYLFDQFSPDNLLYTFSIHWRVKRLSAQTSEGWFSWADTATSGSPAILFHLNGAGVTRLFLDNAYRYSNIPFVVGETADFTLTSKANATELFKNGVSLGTYNAGPVWNSSTNGDDLYLGSGFGGEGFVKVSQLEIFNRDIGAIGARYLYNPNSRWDLYREVERARTYKVPAAPTGFVPYPNPRYSMHGGMQPMDGGV